MTTRKKIQLILDEDAPYADLDDDVYDTMIQIDPMEAIDKLIEEDGWKSVHDSLIDVLCDENSRYCDWQTSASVFCAEAGEGREMDIDLVIGLVYKRLLPDENSSVNNLAWSIASLLKKLSYVESDYNPYEDPAVIDALRERGLSFD